MLYRVTKQYTRGPDVAAAQFADLNDAKIFIQTKLREDAKFKVNVVYRLFEGFELLEEFDQNSAAGGSDDSSGRGSQQSYRPTPLNTAPRPTGMPQNWWKDEEDDKDK